MEEMMLGVLAANNLGFGYRLWLKSAKLIANNYSTKKALHFQN
jgi:hypothetical protein